MLATQQELTNFSPFMSSYLSEGVFQDKFSLKHVQHDAGHIQGRFTLDEFGVSPEDAGGFHLTAPTVFRMTGQLVVIFGHLLGGFEQKSVEVWVRDHQLSHRKPWRDVDDIPVQVVLKKALEAKRHPGMLRLEIELSVGNGAVIGQSICYFDFRNHREHLTTVKQKLNPIGLWQEHLKVL